MNQKRIFALGFFDGVHLGHQALLAECCRLARERDLQTAAITFDRHPRSLFLPTPPKLLNTAQDRKRLLRAYGIQAIYEFPVTEQVMTLPWRTFLDTLMEYGAGGFVCGYDFRFGYRGEGNAEKVEAYCREKNLPWVVVPQQELEGVRISSSHIRGLLEAGDVETAARFLGHPYILSGTVISGRQLGRTLGVPTANLKLPQEVIALPHGVYACKARWEDGEYLAVTNIGNRPTVGGHRITVEPWLLDFQGDLYGQTLTLEFHAFLRSERKFDSLEALREEIQKNALQTRKIFEKS